MVPNAIVTFTADPLFGAFSGGANTALTNASGVASVTLTTSNTSGGAAAVTAISTVGGVAATGAVNYAVGASTLSLSAISLPAGTLSAYGTASVSVDVLNNGAPLYHAIDCPIYLGLRRQRQGDADGFRDHGERNGDGFLSGQRLQQSKPWGYHNRDAVERGNGDRPSCR